MYLGNIFSTKLLKYLVSLGCGELVCLPHGKIFGMSALSVKSSGLKT
jgi:hypothetical protein